MVLRETPRSLAMETTVFSGRVNRSRAWRQGGPGGSRGRGRRRPACRRAWWCQGSRAGGEADPALAQAGDQGDEVLEGAARAVQRGHAQGVAGAQVVQGLPQLLALGVLAGLFAGEDADAAGFGEGVDLTVEQLCLCGHSGVPDEGTGEDGGFGREGAEVPGGLQHAGKHIQIGRPGLLSTQAFRHRFSDICRSGSRRSAILTSHHMILFINRSIDEHKAGPSCPHGNV